MNEPEFQQVVFKELAKKIYEGAGGASASAKGTGS